MVTGYIALLSDIFECVQEGFLEFLKMKHKKRKSEMGSEIGG
jgi:hypothetical protein